MTNAKTDSPGTDEKVCSPSGPERQCTAAWTLADLELPILLSPAHAGMDMLIFIFVTSARRGGHAYIFAKIVVGGLSESIVWVVGDEDHFWYDDSH